jgi:uncharacterized membrane protein
MIPILVFLIALVPLVILDALWITVLMKSFYASQFAGIGMAQPIRLWAGVLVWLLIAAGVVIFILPLAKGNVLHAALYGALFGLILYGVYDLTNYAFIAAWPLKLVFVDIAWGAFLCGAVSAVTQWASTLR